MIVVDFVEHSKVEYDMILIVSRGCVSDISLCSYVEKYLCDGISIVCFWDFDQILVTAVIVVEFRLF